MNNETVATILDKDVHYLITRMHPEDIKLILTSLRTIIREELDAS